jgi:hypothetical protein
VIVVDEKNRSVTLSYVDDEEDHKIVEHYMPV